MERPAPPDLLVLSDRAVDLRRGLVRGPAGDAQLTTKEVELLVFLASRPGRLVTRDELLVGVWGYRPSAVTRAVDNMMRKLRSKVEARPAEPVHLLTVFGEGYRFEPAPVPASAPAPASDARRGNVTAPLHPELGRSELVDVIRGMLGAGRRCVVLLGPQGIGKSTVARRVALDEAADRPGGTWWCPLYEGVEPAELEQRLAATLSTADARLARVLADGRPLLVLDGCDHLSAAAEDLVEGLLAAADGLDVVATSRRLRFDRIGTVVDVPPLDLVAARALVHRHAERVRPGRPLHPADVDRFAERMGRWPLAIELAAARLRALSADEVLQQRPAGGTALDDALDASIAELAPVDREVLQRATLFEGAFGADDAEAVCGPGASRALPRLVDLGLVRVLTTEPTARMVLLDPIRDAGTRDARRPRGSGAPSDREAVRRAHLAWFAERAAAALNPPIAANQAQLRAAEADAWAALRAAFGRDADAAAVLTLALEREVGRLGNPLRRLELVRAALAAGPSPRWAAYLRVAEIEVGAELAPGPSAGPLNEEQALAASLDAAVRSGDLELEGLVLACRAQALRRRGRPEEAEAVGLRAADLAPDGRARARSWLAVAGARLDRGRLDDAAQAFVAAERAASAAGDRRLEGHASVGLALVLRFQERLDDAEACLVRALGASPNEPRLRLDVDLALAQLAAARGDAPRTQALLDAARPRLLQVGDRGREGVAASLAGQVACYARDWAAAEHAMRSWVELCDVGGVAYAEGGVGMCLRLMGRAAEAVAQLERARGLARDHGASSLVARLSAELAAALAEHGRLREAEAELSTLSPSDPFVRVARAHLDLARGQPTDLAALEAELASGSLPLRAALHRVRERWMSTPGA